MNKKLQIIAVLMAVLASTNLAAGDMAEAAGGGIDLLNTMWVLVAAFLVFIMHLGFAMVESGFTRAKNAVNIIMKNIMTIALAGLIFSIIGFSLAFGADSGGFVGNPGDFLGLGGLDMGGVWAGTSISAVAFFLFQMVFAGTSATIVSGAVAERIKFASYIIFAVLIVGFIYPFVAHWIWGGGWLSGLGMIDFAGSTVVHLVGGSAALAGVILLGPRIGKYRDGKVNVIAGHSLPLAALGGFILWFGWYGFNAGSSLAMDSTVPMIAVTTTLAAAAGATMTMLVTWLRNSKPDVGMTINGFLAGLVAITAGCANVGPMSAMMIGAIAGVLVVYAVEFIDQRLRLDDPVGAISVHGVCGAFGTLAVGLFADASYGGISGLLFGGGFDQLAVQFIGVAATFGFVFITAFTAFRFIKAVAGLRVSEQEEVVGLDIGEHALLAYPDFEVPI